MGHHAAAQSRQVVAAFKATDDAALCMLLRDFDDAAGDPCVVGLDQAETGDIVFAMRIKTGRDEDHLRTLRVQRRQPMGLHQFADGLTAGVRRYRNVDHVGRRSAHRMHATVRIQRMLKEADHQHAFVAGKGFLGTIPVMHVEIHDGHTLQTVRLERMSCGDGDIVEQAEAHRAARTCMMAGRTNGAKGIGEFAGHHRIHGGYRCAGCAQCCLPAVLVQQGIGIDGMVAAGARQRIAHGRQRAMPVDTLDLFDAGQWCVSPYEQRRKAAGNQLILDRLQTRRRLGMPVAHFMLAAIGVGKDRGAHPNYYALLVLALYLRLTPVRAASRSGVVLALPSRSPGRPYLVRQPSQPMKATLAPVLLALSAALCLPAAGSHAAGNASDIAGTNGKPAKKPSGTKGTGKNKSTNAKTKTAGKVKGKTMASLAANAKSKRGKSAARGSARAAGGDEDIEFANFNQWRAVSEFIDEMSSQHGFDREQLRTQFGRVRYSDAVVKLINPPPAGKAKNWTAYHDRFIEPQRLQAGVAFWNRHEDALRRAEAEFGVPAEIIVGIIGVETFYGRDAGHFRVVDALTTLAFAYPDTPNRDARKSYFRNELRQVLLYSRENDIDPFTLNGSFAGAIGWPQFMPGSIRQYAVDFDGDGKIDLRNSPVDAVGSVASFLSHHGWQSGLPLVYPAAVSPATDAGWPALIGQGLEAKYTLGQMKEAGVNVALTVPDTIPYGLVDLQDGERPTRYWIGTSNFYAITQYNRSFFYAMAVIDLGQAVGRQRLK